jgi:protease-4
MSENQTFSLIVMDRARRRWRFIAILVVLFFILFAVSNSPSKVNVGPYVARIDLEGFIGSDREKLATLYGLGAKDSVKAVMVYIDSPGGTMVGGLDVYKAFNRISKVKPVVCVMGTTAASAGYMVSLGCSHVIASEATLTGSIGVFMPLVDATALADKLGVKSVSIASGSLKMATSPLEKPTEDAQVYLQDMVNDLQKTFMHYVEKHRPINDEIRKVISDGRALTGRRAYELKLVDGLGDMLDAKEWLEKQHGITGDVPIRNILLKKEKNFFEKAMSSLSWVEGFSTRLSENAILATVKP